MYRYSANKIQTAKHRLSAAVLTLVLIPQSACMVLKCKMISAIMDSNVSPDAALKRNVHILCNATINVKLISNVCKQEDAVVMNSVLNKSCAREIRRQVTIVTRIANV